MSEENRRCPQCNTPIEPENSTCPSCQTFLQDKNTAAQNISKAQPFYKKPIFLITLLAILLIGTVTAFAKPFTPAKELLKQSLLEDTPEIKTLQSTFTLNTEKMDLHFEDSSVSQEYIEKMDNSQISCQSKVNIPDKKMENLINLTYNNNEYKLPIFFTDSTCILNTTGIVQLAKDLNLLPPEIEQMLPEYFYTGAAEEEDIQEIWKNFSLWNKKANNSEVAAYKQLTLLILDAVPEKYFERTGLSKITFSFNQEGLQDITAALIKHIYANKEKYANLAGEIAVHYGESKEEIKKQFLSTLEEQPLEEVLNNTEEGFKEINSTIQLNRFSIVMNKDLGSNLDTNLKCDLEIKKSKNNTCYGNIVISGAYSNQYNNTVNITVPELNNSNSACIDQF